MDKILACKISLDEVNPTDPDSIARSTEVCGLYPYLDWQLAEFPRETHRWCGRGIGLWQYPSQFGPYLAEIAKRLKKVRSYAEIGTAAGGTFLFTTEFLKLFAGLEVSYAVDIANIGTVSYIGQEHANPFDGIFEQYLRMTPYAHFFHGNSSKFADLLKDKHETIDLLLIDADHTYQAVKQDFEILAPFASCIVFHDIVNDHCRGVGQFWAEVKQLDVYDSVEFVAQCPTTRGSFLGIGVLFPKSACKR